MIIQQISPKYYNLNNASQARANAQQQPISKAQQSVSFNGKLPKPKILDKLENAIARGLGRLADTKTYEKLINETNKHKSLIDDDKGLLFPHLIVFGSTLLSAFYVVKTLKNKEMEDSKKKTLAINQGLVYGVSTVLAYTFDISVKTKFKKMLTNFKNANAENVRTGRMTQKQLDAAVVGFKMAKSMIAIDLVYRFIAPVLVTPLANAIGNRLHDNKATKKAAKQANLDKQA